MLLFFLRNYSEPSNKKRVKSLKDVVDPLVLLLNLLHFIADLANNRFIFRPWADINT